MAKFYNHATLSYSGGSTNSNVVCGELKETLRISKTPVADTYSPGDSITYVVSIVNKGRDVRNATVTDDLGAYEQDGETRYPLEYVEGSLLYYVNGEQRPAPDVEAGPPLEIQDVDIPRDSNVTLIYDAQVTAFAPIGPGGTIENTVSVDGCASVDPVVASATVTVECEPRLTISKSLCPDKVPSCGGKLTYTFVIQNSGCEAAEEDAGIVVSDTFNPILRHLRAELDGETLDRGPDYTYDKETGEFATVAGRITVPAATFEQQEDGSWVVTPGVAVLTVSGEV